MSQNFEFKIDKADYPDVISVKILEQSYGLSSWTQKDYELEIERGEGLFFVLKINRKIEGFILARLIMKRFQIRDEILGKNSTRSQFEIYNLVVSYEYQRQDFGNKLLQTVFEQVEQFSPAEVFLEVRESNFKAIRFYQKNGFVISGKRKNFYTLPTESAILMVAYI